jgi:hypothetical protein
MSEEQANSVFIGDNVDNAPGLLFVITKDKDSFISLEICTNSITLNTVTKHFPT